MVASLMITVKAEKLSMKHLNTEIKKKKRENMIKKKKKSVVKQPTERKSPAPGETF